MPSTTFGLTEQTLGQVHLIEDDVDHNPFVAGVQKTPPDDWATATGPVALPILASEGTYDPNFYNKVASAHTASHNEGCAVLRKRVALWLKQQGCPSIVKGHKKAKKAKCGSKKKSPAPKKKSACCGNVCKR